jgi:hypothetical protein
METTKGTAKIKEAPGTAVMFNIEVSLKLADGQSSSIFEGDDVQLLAQLIKSEPMSSDAPKKVLDDTELRAYTFTWTAKQGDLSGTVSPQTDRPWEATFETSGLKTGTWQVQVVVAGPGVIKDTTEHGRGQRAQDRATIPIELQLRPVFRGPSLPVVLNRSASQETGDTVLSPIIRGSTGLLGFTEYSEFVDTVMCEGPASNSLSSAARSELARMGRRRGTPFPGVDAYQLLKVATEVYVMLNCGVLTDLTFSDDIVAAFNQRHGRSGRQQALDTIWARYLEDVNGILPASGTPRTVKTLPYLAAIRRRLKDVPITPNGPAPKDLNDPNEGGVCDGIMEKKLTRPCFFELIWSYWHEEGMLVQSMNAIAVRFQNQRVSDHDPLAQLDIDPLRPLSNLLWGYIQDEQHRLTVARRNYEYDHHYGLTLQGKAVPVLRSADSRSKFLEAFHNLLHAALLFYDQDDDTTIKADGFSVLNGLKETHLLLTEGMHNQFGDLPSNARIEMLMQQWILARPEMREFIGGRTMVNYTEEWMDRVDTMKKLQGWTDVSVTYFNELARFGEQLLLSIRYGEWNAVVEPESAANWAREWRAEVKQYVHAYRAATGVDLSPGQVDQRLAADRYAQPSVHLRKRLNDQRQRPADAAASPRRIVAGSRNGNGNGASRPARTPQNGGVLAREIE